jgi:hypothetical protein
MGSAANSFIEWIIVVLGRAHPLRLARYIFFYIENTGKPGAIHTDVVSATYCTARFCSAVSMPPCSTVAGTPICSRLSAAGHDSCVPQEGKGREGKGRTLVARTTFRLG